MGKVFNRPLLTTPFYIELNRIGVMGAAVLVDRGGRGPGIMRAGRRLQKEQGLGCNSGVRGGNQLSAPATGGSSGVRSRPVTVSLSQTPDCLRTGRGVGPRAAGLAGAVRGPGPDRVPQIDPQKENTAPGETLDKRRCLHRL